MSEQDILQTHAYGAIDPAHTAEPKASDFVPLREDVAVDHRHNCSGSPPSREGGSRMKKLFSAMFVMLPSFILIILSVRALAHIYIKPPDPLFANANDFIGQPVSVIEGFGFSCSLMADYVLGSNDPHELHCSPESASDTFSEIVLVSSEDTIHQIVFTMHKGAIQSGHLIWFWGKPEARSHGRSVYLYWRTRGIVAVGRCEARPLSPSLRVYKVYYLGCDGTGSDCSQEIASR